MGTLWCIIYKFHKDSFPNVLKLAAVAFTMPIHTADWERGFSLQNNLKNCQRNRHVAEMLDALMIAAKRTTIKRFPIWTCFNQMEGKEITENFFNISH